MALGFIQHIGDSIVNHPGQLLTIPGGKMSFVYIIPLVLGDWYLRRDERNLYISNVYIESIISSLILMLLAFNFSADSSFIYFQF
jgi:hypothetical protein